MLKTSFFFLLFFISLRKLLLCYRYCLHSCSLKKISFEIIRYKVFFFRIFVLGSRGEMYRDEIRWNVKNSFFYFHNSQWKKFLCTRWETIFVECFNKLSVRLSFFFPPFSIFIKQMPEKSIHRQCVCYETRNRKEKSVISYCIQSHFHFSIRMDADAVFLSCLMMLEGCETWWHRERKTRLNGNVLEILIMPLTYIPKDF